MSAALNGPGYYDSSMTDDEFHQAVAVEIDLLPEEFRSKLDNVEVVVEDLPRQDQLVSLGIRSPFHLYGLYEGIPITKREAGYSFVAPDKITLFKSAIERVSPDPTRVRRKIRAVLLHEIGHHFGLSEADLSKYPRVH